MSTWISRLPMLLALEADYNTVGWIYEGRYRAEVFSEQEVQPMFVMKDTWELCVCEGADALSPEPYGQWDPTSMELFREYIWCPVNGYNGGSVPQYRYDWRPGRELSEEQATRWALAHGPASDAHHLFNGPRKEATASVDLPQARGVTPSRVEVDGVDISQWVVGSVDIQFTEWQRAYLDLPRESINVAFIPDEYFSDGGGTIRVSDGRDFLSVPVAGPSLEDRDFIEDVVRTTVDRFEHWRRERERSRRESGGADSGGPPPEGAAE